MASPLCPNEPIASLFDMCLFRIQKTLNDDRDKVMELLAYEDLKDKYNNKRFV